MIFRYQEPDVDLKNFQRPCNHNNKSTYKCNNITLTDIKRNKRKIYSTSNKSDQEIRLCHLMSSVTVSRRRPVKEAPKKREVNVSYFLKSLHHKHPLKVCHSFFVKALGLSPRRVNRVANLINNGEVPIEKRGGDKRSQNSSDRIQSVKQFIGHLKGKESHYNRSKSKKIYLDSSLSIRKLHSLYNTKNDSMKVSLSMFSRIFRGDFHIGFSSPASDACGTCMKLEYKIKMEKSNEKKNEFVLEKKIHLTRAKAFYELSKENPPSSLTFCFDLQQVQPLPRTPISDAFYAQQVSYYVFCCVDMGSRHPSFYTWSEDQAGRGSVQIGSALLHHLDSLNLDDIHTLRLFCDGCGGQNKNAHIVHALYYWLKVKSPQNLKEIRITYPVRGHSFLPADRVFGRVEKLLRKTSVVKTKDEYKNIYSKCGEVKELGVDWHLYDIKSLQNTFKKLDGILDLKRINLKKGRRNSIEIFCYQNFRFETLSETPKNLLKKGKSDKNLPNLGTLPLNNFIPEKKKKSLKHLLEQQFGEDWAKNETLSWYKGFLLNENENQGLNHHEGDDDDDQEDEHCDCLEEDAGAQYI